MPISVKRYLCCPKVQTKGRKKEMKGMIARCPYCNSIWVCWNWMHSFGGDLDAYCKANPHMTREELKQSMWGHECWDCDNVNQTENKVTNGIPYKVLRLFYNLFHKKGKGD